MPPSPAKIVMIISRKTIFTLVRIAICAVALWIVARGITLSDQITLRDGTTLDGRIEGEGASIELRLPSGDLQSIPRNEIAASKDGTLKIAFGLYTTLWRSSKGLLFLALLLYFPVVFPQAYRLYGLLRAQGIPVSYADSLKVSFAGNFLNFATPFGSNAGDLFKAYFVSLHTPLKTEAVTTVVLDRFVGLGTLLLVAGGITAVSPPGSRLAMVRPFVLTMLGVGLVAFVIYRSPLGRRVMQGLPAWGPIEQLKRVDQAAHHLTGHLSALIVATLLTVLLQAMALLAFFFIAMALSMKANSSNVLEYFAYFYTGTLIAALPGPPQGLGTVELAYRYFFESFGTVSQIVCMAFAIRLTGLISSLPGLLVTMTGAYRPRDNSASNSGTAPEVDVSDIPISANAIP
ncbi:MAG: flippase-like domain-containing protein [Planctomycetes bacterium]|nr:flippase-like domain-containing protein [Planctomycetota bacterium]